MRTILKAGANIAATCGIALLILRWIAWIPGTPAATSYIIDTAAWHGLRSVVAWLRLTLGATVGPEDDELMFIDCYTLISLGFAIGIVSLANRFVRRIARSKNRTDTSRAASVAS